MSKMATKTEKVLKSAHFMAEENSILAFLENFLKNEPVPDIKLLNTIEMLLLKDVNYIY